MPELKSSYDVVIVGSDLPALIFGALAAKNGYRVLLLGHGGKPNSYEQDGFRFVRRPNLLYGFSEAQAIREVFRELALLPEMRNMPRPMDPICSVVLPRRRIEISHVRGILEEELNREYPGMLDRFMAFYQRQADAEKSLEPLLKSFPTIPPGGIGEFFRWRSVKKHLTAAFGEGDALEEFSDSPSARAFLGAPVSVLNMTTDAWKHPVTFGRATNHMLQGLYNVEWGVDSLKNLFLSRIEGNSGTVRMGEYADQILTRRGRVTEVDVRGRNEAIGASMLVAGTGLTGILDMLPEKAVGRRYREKVTDSGPTHFLVTINIGLSRRGIPAGMARTAFLVNDPSLPLEGTNLLTLQVDPAMEPADALDPARAAMSVSGMIPASAITEGAASVETFGEAMLARVREFMPFLDRHLVTTSLAATRLSEKTGKSVLDPAGMIPVHGNVMPGMLGLVTQPVRTPWRNMLNLGEGATGSMGFEGAFSAASMAFDIVRKVLPRKDVIQHSRGV